MSLHNVVLQVVPEETNSERMISLRLLTAPEIKLIGKLLLLGLKNGTAFYIESRITLKSGTALAVSAE